MYVFGMSNALPLHTQFFQKVVFNDLRIQAQWLAVARYLARNYDLILCARAQSSPSTKNITRFLKLLQHLRVKKNLSIRLERMRSRSHLQCMLLAVDASPDPIM